MQYWLFYVSVPCDIYCEMQDIPEYTSMECERWLEEGQEMAAEVKCDIEDRNTIDGCGDNWISIKESMKNHKNERKGGETG